jgi:hypothetical protein
MKDQICALAPPDCEPNLINHCAGLSRNHSYARRNVQRIWRIASPGRAGRPRPDARLIDRCEERRAIWRIDQVIK